jgi:H+/Cl- antiporter ClcA
VQRATHLGDFSATRRMLVIAAIAAPIGAVSAVVAWGLLRLIGLITNGVFYHRVATSLVAPGAIHHNPFLIVFAPVLGGLVIGLMARYGSEKIRGHGMPEAIEAILIGGSKVQPRVALLKPVASAVAIGTGGPFGAEGPIIMTGGAVGSLLAQFLHLTADERKTLLVSGAAAGMAATFNTPLAALLLAVELLLFEWRPRSFVPVSVSVAVATGMRWHLLGSGLLFPVHGRLHIGTSALLLCAVSGIVSGLLAIVATVLVYASEDGFRLLPLHWMWWPAIGGLVIGLGGLAVPQALGVGYNVIDAELTGSIGLGLVTGILIVKTLIWSLSLGSGTSGGVLAPMFMIGGALGTVESHLFVHVGVGFWPLVALAGVLGGVMRSPFTGVVFAIELTGRIDAVLPLLIGSAVAYGVSVLMLKRSVLTEKIARRGYHLSREYDVDPLETLFVADVMAAWDERMPVLPPPRVATYPDATLREVAYLMADHDTTHCVVVARPANPDAMADAAADPLGVVSLQDLLVGRARDLAEARDSERVLQIPLRRRPDGRRRSVRCRRSRSSTPSLAGYAPDEESSSASSR